MRTMIKTSSFALLFLLLAPVAGWSQQFFFIHIPPSSSGRSLDDIVDGLKDISDILETDFAYAGNPSPKICWLGFSGPWDAGGVEEPNLAGEAANAIAGADPNDNHTGGSVPINYCAVNIALGESLAECDIVIALGEGDDNDKFCLEDHGDPELDPEEDCAGQVPDDREHVCKGGECSGTDWDQPTHSGCLNYWHMMECYYPADNPIGVKPNENGGEFTCGYACCCFPDRDPQPEPPPQDGENRLRF